MNENSSFHFAVETIMPTESLRRQALPYSFHCSKLIITASTHVANNYIRYGRSEHRSNHEGCMSCALLRLFKVLMYLQDFSDDYYMNEEDHDLLRAILEEVMQDVLEFVKVHPSFPSFAPFLSR